MLKMKKSALLLICLLAYFLAACNSSESTAEITAAALTGYRVVDSEGELVAEVAEVLIDAESGRITYAIVTLEGGAFQYSKAAFVTTATSRAAVPWAYFLINESAKQLRLHVGKSILFAAPRLDEEPRQLESNWDAPVRAFWQTYAVPGSEEGIQPPDA
jgi:sporulation protein YlmC with PRC-barrel domain